MCDDIALGCHPLAPAVLAQLSDEVDDAVSSAIDAANHGADSGFPGFTYYSDTCAFTAVNRQTIKDAVCDMADQLGECPLEMVQAFGCLKSSRVSCDAVGIALWGDGTTGMVESDTRYEDVMLIENALAWFALEEVGRAFVDAREGGAA